MKIKTNKSTLLQLLTPSQGLIEKRNTIPILSKILIKVEKEELKVFSTNQENSLQSTRSIDGQSGAVCVDSKNLFEIVKELPEGEVLLEKQKDKQGLKLKTATSVFNMVGVNPEDYPVFPAVKNPKFVSIPSSDLFSLINQTIYCTSNDETRYHLNGVFFEKRKDMLRFVSTDGHRLSYAEKQTKEDIHLSKGIIIPKRGLNEISRLISLEEHTVTQLAVEPPRLLVKYGAFY